MKRLLSMIMAVSLITALFIIPVEATSKEDIDDSVRLITNTSLQYYDLVDTAYDYHTTVPLSIPTWSRRDSCCCNTYQLPATLLNGTTANSEVLYRRINGGNYSSRWLEDF